MSELKDLLSAGDPARVESQPTGPELDQLLCRLQAEAAASGSIAHPRGGLSPGVALRVVATGVAFGVALVLVTYPAWRRQPSAPGDGAAQVLPQPPDGTAAHPPVEVRHLQFATPEGVRVFWTFDPNFNEDRP